MNNANLFNSFYLYFLIFFLPFSNAWIANMDFIHSANITANFLQAEEGSEFMWFGEWSVTWN